MTDTEWGFFNGMIVAPVVADSETDARNKAWRMAARHQNTSHVLKLVPGSTWWGIVDIIDNPKIQLCEWNPGASAPATDLEGCNNPSVVIIDNEEATQVCASCAMLPELRDKYPQPQGSSHATDATGMTPTQLLILDLLGARHRLGENTGAFDGRNTTALRALEHRGLIGWKHGTVQGTCLAWLTPDGRKHAISDSYVSPLEKDVDKMRRRVEYLLKGPDSMHLPAAAAAVLRCQRNGRSGNS